MDLATVLNNTQHHDQNIRTQAESYLNQAVETQYGPFLLALCIEFAADGRDVGVRQAAGLFMKNMISAEDEAIKQDKAQRWASCDPTTKEQVKQGFLMALSSTNPTVSHTAAQVVSAFGAVELPMNSWPQLLPTVFQNISSPEVPDSVKVSSLETLGYMCNAMKVKIEPQLVNQILGSIIEGMRSDRRDDIRLAAVVALNNSLGFTDTNFDNDTERDHIMTAICAATQAPNPAIRKQAYECCATVAEFYYEKLQPYVSTLYNLTVSAIQTDDPTVGTQAIEFWITVAETERDIREDIADGARGPEAYLNISCQAAETLMPLILLSMTKQFEDEDDENSWDISKAAATLLEILSAVMNDDVVDLVMPFVTGNVANTDWHFKEAAILAFGMILDGPSDARIGPLVLQSLTFLIGCLRDGHRKIRDTTAWTLGRICELHRTSLPPEALQGIIEGLSAALEDRDSHVVCQVCYALYAFAQSFAEESDAPSNILSHIIPTLVPKLLEISMKPSLELDQVRPDAFETINKMVEYSAMDMHPFLLQLLTELLNRIEQTMNPSIATEHRTGLQSCLSSLISEIVPKLSAEQFAPYADRTMQVLLQIFSHHGTVAHEDAFLAMGKVADCVKGDFLKYMPYLQVHIINSLKNFEEYQLCSVAVGMVGDCCRALSKQMMPFCDEIMRCLLESLQSPVLHRIVKPHVFAVFADVALAIEGDFERYCSIVLDMLKQAGEVNIEIDDEDLIEYINSLRLSLLEAYVGIIQGLDAAGMRDLVAPVMNTIVDFISRSATDPNHSTEVLKTAIGLLGDLGMIYGAAMRPIFSMPFLVQMFKNAEEDEIDRELTQWAKGQIQSVLSGR
jgi:importin subunit beta-1